MSKKKYINCMMPFFSLMSMFVFVIGLQVFGLSANASAVTDCEQYSGNTSAYSVCLDAQNTEDTNTNTENNEGTVDWGNSDYDPTDANVLKDIDSIWGLLLTIINILTAGIGIAAVGGVVYAAVLYSSAGANADNVKKAKGMFVNIGIGIVAYILMYSFLNYLIPGGLFN